MGGKESKPYSLSYEEAVKRVSDAELSRLKAAYKRTATNAGAITCHSFSKEVLGESVPQQLSQQIFVACGGSSKGITFKDLLCSLVLLTQGKTDEKIKFIFSVYGNETGSHILKTDFQRRLQATEGIDASRRIVRQCFGQNERVSYEEFRSWLVKNPDATSITRWLLCASGNPTASIAPPLDTPTFYQTLAGVTHLEESEILELEKRYWVLKGSSPTGRLDPGVLSPLLAPPLTAALARGLFNAFDENRDGHIDFKEMACGISAACRGPQTERQKFVFKIFDRDGDGLLDRTELRAMVAALLALSIEDREDDWDADGVCMGVEGERVSSVVETMLREHDPGGRGALTLEDYLIWTLDNTLTHTFLTIIFQVCHIVLGLRPNSPREEGEIVLGWLHRAETRTLTVGHFWYIVNIDWWNTWADYVLGQGNENWCGSPSSHMSSCRRTKLQKKAAHDKGSVASDNNGVTVRSISSLSTLSLDDALSVGIMDGEVVSNCWGGPVSRGSSSLSLGHHYYHHYMPAHHPNVSAAQSHLNDGATTTTANANNIVTSLQGLPMSNNISSSNSSNNTAGNSNSTGSSQWCNGRVGGDSVSSSDTESLVSVVGANGAGANGAGVNGSALSPHRRHGSSLYLHTGIDSTRSSACSSPSPSPHLRRRSNGGACPRPPAIDNSVLVEAVTAQQRALQLTWEGGRLKRNTPLAQGRDFVLLPEPLWKTLHQWYGGAPALPRQVIHGRGVGSVELELYPVTLRLYRHVQPRPSPSPSAVGGAATHWMGVMGGYGVAAISRIADSAPGYVTGLASNLSNSGSNKRYLAHLAAFSRLATLTQVYCYLGDKLRLATDDMRLWLITTEDLVLLEDCTEETLGGAGVTDLSDVLLEVRNKDLTWPEEMNLITTAAPTHNAPIRQNSVKTGNIEKGVTGLNNLGNTCFLNAAIQCCSNTVILTTYFQRNLHLYELNPDNPCGMRGHMAREYGNLLHQIWGGEARSVAPLKLRWTIGKWSGNFTGVEQHDSQELLAFLLDGLHEDLNRVQHKPYSELKDSEGRPDTLVAQEAWENHIVRNKSIIVDLFHGQLKSKVTCKVCCHQSARFDPFTYLSLQLPMESYTHLEVILVRLNGSVPVKYGLRLIEDSKYKDIKQHLHTETGILPQYLMLADLTHQPPQIKYVPVDECRIRQSIGTVLYAYELPAPLHSSAASSTATAAATYQPNGPFSVADFIKARQQPQQGSLTEEEKQAKEQELQLLQRQQQDEQQQQQQQGNSRSAKDRQTLAQIQRATTTNSARHNSNTLAVTSDVLDAGDRRASISPAPSPEPPPLQSESVVVECEVSPQRSSSASPPSPAAPTFHSPVHTEADLAKTNKGFLIAYHRKLLRQEVYFLASEKCRPSLFGLPLVVPCGEHTTHKSLYQSVWLQVSRLVTPLPPTEAAAGTNHAADCDDSLGYEFPFLLRMVEREGLQCAVCPWYQFCRGCHLSCNDNVFPTHNVAFLAIDWDPTALHLRYQSTLEKSVQDDSSVLEQRRRHTEPISLQHCLEAYTAEETLEYSCQHCRKMQPAAKKLQIWRLPPVLIVHLKRFQLVGQKWIKSQKIVQFPLRNFDPSDYLASVPRETIALHRAQLDGKLGSSNDAFQQHSSLPVLPENKIRNGLIKGMNLNGGANSLPPLILPDCALHSSSSEEEEEEEQSSSSLSAASSRAAGRAPRVRNGSVLYGDTLQDFHQHRLHDDIDPLTLSYDLYAIACHIGVMEAGHYVCYAKNLKGKWICFNDSSCKEVSEHELDLESAYLLFYERRGLDASQYLPNVSGKSPHPLTQLDSEAEAEYKKQCSIM